MEKLDEKLVKENQFFKASQNNWTSLNYSGAFDLYENNLSIKAFGNRRHSDAQVNVQ